MTAPLQARRQLASINVQLKISAIIVGVTTALALAAIGTMVYFALPLATIAITAIVTGAALALITTIALSILAITSRPVPHHPNGAGQHDSWESS